MVNYSALGTTLWNDVVASPCLVSSFEPHPIFEKIPSAFYTARIDWEKIAKITNNSIQTIVLYQWFALILSMRLFVVYFPRFHFKKINYSLGQLWRTTNAVWGMLSMQWVLSCNYSTRQTEHQATQLLWHRWTRWRRPTWRILPALINALNC